MSIQTDKSLVVLNGDGVNTTWDFDFKIWVKEDLAVLTTSADGTITDKVVPTDEWSLTIFSDQVGGRITYPLGGSPLATGWKITIMRDMDFLQPNDYQRGQGFDPNAIEDMGDKNTAYCQQLKEALERAVKVSTASGQTADELIRHIEDIAKEVDADAATVATAMANLFSDAFSFTTTPGQLAYTLPTTLLDPLGKNIHLILGGVPQQPGVAFDIEAPNKITFKEDPKDQSCWGAVTLSKSNPDIRGIIDGYLATTQQTLVDEGTAQTQAVTNAGTTAQANIATDEAAAIAQITANKDQAAQDISAMTGYARDYQAISDDKSNGLISGGIAGTEGARKFQGPFLHTPASVDYYDEGLGWCTRLILGSGAVGIQIGGSGFLTEKQYGVVIGDSGQPYTIKQAFGLSVRIHPKHGDVRSDFTAGKSYMVYVLQESTDVQTGDLDVVEYVAGGMNLDNTDLYIHKQAGMANVPTDNLGYGWATDAPVTVNADGSITTVDDSTLLYKLRAHNRDETSKVRSKKIRFTGNVSGGTIDGIRIGTSSVDGSVSTQNISSNVNVTGDFSIDVDIVDSPVGSRLAYLMVQMTGAGALTLSNLRLVLISDIEYLSGMISVDSIATLNSGYWEGKDWQNQLLSKCKQYGSYGDTAHRLSIKLNRKASSVEKVEILKADGSWITVAAGDAQTDYHFSFNATTNWIVLNTHGATGWGYASTEDLLLNAVVRISYKTRSRVVRPDVNPNNVKYISRAFVLQHNNGVLGSYLASDLTGEVITAGSGYPLSQELAKYGWAPAFKKLPSFIDTEEYTIADPSNPNRVIVVFGLYEKSDTLHIVTFFKELVYDGDWGDNGRIDTTVDNVVTTTDDNGNVVLTGCMSYDTGLPA